MDLIEVRFPPSGIDGFDAVRRGFAQDVGALIEPSKERHAKAGGSASCEILVPASGVSAYLLKKGGEVSVVFGTTPSGEQLIDIKARCT